jgi:hypothetical protein
MIFQGTIPPTCQITQIDPALATMPKAIKPKTIAKSRNLPERSGTAGRYSIASSSRTRDSRARCNKDV